MSTPSQYLATYNGPTATVGRHGELRAGDKVVLKRREWLYVQQHSAGEFTVDSDVDPSTPAVEAAGESPETPVESAEGGAEPTQKGSAIAQNDVQQRPQRENSAQPAASPSKRTAPKKTVAPVRKR
jgi:hypothetical protein